MKTATYLRVSTDDGKQTLDPQRIELGAFAAARGWDKPKEFSDVISGAKSQRAGLDALMAAVRRKEISVVLVVKLDRLARSLAHFAQLVAEFDKYGCALVATSQGIDTSKDNPAGRLQMHVLAAVAEFERSLIRERTKAGLVAARARGSILGRPSAKLPANWQAIVTTWRQETAGIGIRELARRLKGVSLSTAWRLSKT